MQLGHISVNIYTFYNIKKIIYMCIIYLSLNNNLFENKTWFIEFLYNTITSMSYYLSLI